MTSSRIQDGQEQSNIIHPGLLWPDDRGKHIQAHGGGIIKLGDAWYWFGEDRSKDNDPNKRRVACYSSKNLVNWRFHNQVDVDREVALIQAPLEGGAIVNYEGLYYVVGSALTGWWPDANKYATANLPEGPWSEFKDFAPAISHTYMSQSTSLIKVVGSGKTTVIYVGDRWRPEEQWDSRYVWMPVEIGGGAFLLPEPKPWSIDVETGEVTVLD